jgi:hypothetical protein
MQYCSLGEEKGADGARRPAAGSKRTDREVVDLALAGPRVGSIAAADGENLEKLVQRGFTEGAASGPVVRGEWRRPAACCG